MTDFVYLETYCHMLSALESYDAENMPIGNIAMESDTIASVNKEYNKKYAELTTKLQKQCNNDDNAGAAVTLAAIEGLLTEWKESLRKLPKDNLSTGLHIAKKVLVLALSTVAIVAAPAAASVVFGSVCTTVGIAVTNNVLQTLVKMLMTAAIQGKAFSKIFTTVLTIIMEAFVKKEASSEYKNDPNGKSALYQTTLLGIDEAIREIAQLKAGLRFSNPKDKDAT